MYFQFKFVFRKNNNFFFLCLKRIKSSKALTKLKSFCLWTKTNIEVTYYQRFTLSNQFKCYILDFSINISSKLGQFSFYYFFFFSFNFLFQIKNPFGIFHYSNFQLLSGGSLNHFPLKKNPLYIKLLAISLSNIWLYFWLIGTLVGDNVLITSYPPLWKVCWDENKTSHDFAFKPWFLVNRHIGWFESMHEWISFVCQKGCFIISWKLFFYISFQYYLVNLQNKW